MNKFINLIFLFSIILLFDIVYAKNKINGESKTTLSKSDNYYIVILNNTLSIDTAVNRKRSLNETISEQEEIDANINLTINKIYNLIMDNKESYKDIKKFEEIENQEVSNLNKREDTVDSNFVYELITANQRTALYTYLSDELKDDIMKSFDNVISCLPRRKFELNYYYSRTDIKSETHWNSLKVRKNVSSHLSLISQGNFNEKLVDQYDKNFYYPESAGKDVDIFMFDTGFNFTYKDFSSNRDERNVKCEVIIQNGRISLSHSNDECYTSYMDDHGSMTSSVAGGTVHGVAENANIIGIVLGFVDNNVFWEDIVTGLKYVESTMFKSNKAVFNFSFGGYFNEEELQKDDIIILQDTISSLSDKGAVFVASAGNRGVPSYDTERNLFSVPCILDDVICVGGISNNLENESGEVIFSSDTLKINDEMINSKYMIDSSSNFGRGVDIYAPFWIHYNSSYIINENTYNYYVSKGASLDKAVHFNGYYYYIENIDFLSSGTSISAPIVSGVAASIMSEHPDMEFTSKTMLQYLRKIGEKNIIGGIPEDESNVFINNGKHTVYSSNKKYNGCGIYAGNKKCAHNKCCSRDGKCTTSSNNLCKSSNGCQKKYGNCKAVESVTKGRCGIKYGSCSKGYCCSYDGKCGKSEDYCGIGCQINFGICK